MPEFIHNRIAPIARTSSSKEVFTWDLVGASMTASEIDDSGTVAPLDHLVEEKIVPVHSHLPNY